jgi:hypothetical protein
VGFSMDKFLVFLVGRERRQGGLTDSATRMYLICAGGWSESCVCEYLLLTYLLPSHP